MHFKLIKLMNRCVKNIDDKYFQKRTLLDVAVDFLACIQTHYKVAISWV